MADEVRSSARVVCEHIAVLVLEQSEWPAMKARSRKPQRGQIAIATPQHHEIRHFAAIRGASRLGQSSADARMPWSRITTLFFFYQLQEFLRSVHTKSLNEAIIV